MPVSLLPDYIRCSFSSEQEADTGYEPGRVDIFFATSLDLASIFDQLSLQISPEERLRAGKMIVGDTRDIFIMSHAILRICLSRYLDIKPLEIEFSITKNSKPFLKNQPLHFNISHTNGAFVIAISPTAYVGIDIESVRRMNEFYSVARTFFSKREQDFIFNNSDEADERFLLLWTRKESLLKALGTGMIDHLELLEVSEDENCIDRNIFSDLIDGVTSVNHYIYSMKQLNYMISLTVPSVTITDFHHLKPTDLISTI
jgi:phosphopantetheine--protein transferase-like protein